MVFMVKLYLEIEPLVSRSRESGCPGEYFQDVMPHVILQHLLAEQGLGDAALLHQFLQQTEEEGLLSGIGM
jgi:hypothetical protein